MEFNLIPDIREYLAEVEKPSRHATRMRIGLSAAGAALGLGVFLLPAPRQTYGDIATTKALKCIYTEADNTWRPGAQGLAAFCEKRSYSETLRIQEADEARGRYARSR
ncbi:hypothetical protein [Sphingomonas abietis]|uniref:Uncharacterized protein n=1 Tax=Sphingomonas abietis TaxID=3012344 RepID=A0ABY7NQT8_9SPHN|nr:hypothetical protein [Sphingomonas abietis]WBO23914.1 hypothetical protein PBT88_07340 [Sphingomonas abietis]